MLSLGWSLVVWLLILIVVAFVARRFHLTWLAAILLGLTIATIVLALLYRPTVNSFSSAGGGALAGIFWAIMFLVPLAILIYSLWKMVTDKDYTKLPVVAVAPVATRF